MELGAATVLEIIVEEFPQFSWSIDSSIGPIHWETSCGRYCIATSYTGSPGGMSLIPSWDRYYLFIDGDERNSEDLDDIFGEIRQDIYEQRLDNYLSKCLDKMDSGD